MSSEARQPLPPPWDDQAPIALGAAVGVKNGLAGVQFIGRRTLGITNEAMTVPLPVLLQAFGQLAMALGSDTPEGDALRKLLAATRFASAVKPT